MARWIKAVVAGFIFIFIIRMFCGFYIDWLWFNDLGYTQLFWTPLLSKLTFQAINGTILLVFIAGTLISIRHSIITFMNDRLRRQLRLVSEFDLLNISQRKVTIGLVFISALISYTASFISGFSGWLEVLTLIKPTYFGMKDPVFGLDLMFYFFQLPFLQTIFSSLFGPLVILTLFTAVFYTATGVIQFHSWKLWQKNGVEIGDGGRRHLAILTGILFAFRGFGYYLDMYLLVYSQQGYVFGAGYTDLHANMPVLKGLIVFCCISLGMVLAAFHIKEARFLTLPVSGTFLFALIFLGIYPHLFQTLFVVPNELNKESGNIAQEIYFTRYGYGLDKIQEKEYPGNAPLNGRSFYQEQEMLNNIQLNNNAQLLNIYAQKQGMRLYYKFNDIDTDRYRINGEYRQVLLSPRELSSQDLEPKAKTFVNMRMKYTHGYGVVGALANGITNDGLPSFLLRDMPAFSLFTELQLTEPRIYYGELTKEWVVVNTGFKEFDFPQGESNEETVYQGSTGIRMTLLNKMVFTIHKMTGRFFLSKEIHEESKILLVRNIKERLEKLAPFLSYDEDPYLVVDNGRLKWMVDAYTTSNTLPYSNYYPGENLNYIRNSVKAVIDAYDGMVDFYVMDENDPIIKTYQKIFPGVFKESSQMSPALKSHLRYPKTLFNMQSNMMKTFHITNSAIYYNKEEAWDIGKELYSNEPHYVEPYYAILKLPDSGQAEFLLMLPFTPSSSTTNSRNNMVAWMAARMDGEHYGELMLYKLPENREVSGPLQIESRIDQDPEISRQLALWNQNGSRVIRGHLLTIPVQGNFVYIEPIYLQSSKSGSIPELKRVILAYEDKIVMEENLGTALIRIFGSNVPQPLRLPTDEAISKEDLTNEVKIQELIIQINEMRKILDQMEKNIDQWSGK